MRILITGGTGLLGKALIEAASNSREILATHVGDYIVEDTHQVKYLRVDVRDENGHEKIFVNFRPEIVIHTASIGSPDFAERNKEITWEINVNGVRRLLSLCEKYNSAFINISSNGIYDGANAPYCEDDKAVPINYYGETKLRGEEIVKKASVPFAIIRPILMYGWNHAYERANIVTLSLEKLKNNAKVYAYDDVYSNPLFAGNCAEAIWAIIANKQFEDFNIAGRVRMSIYELILKAAEVFGLDKNLVIPVKQGYFNELVPRPKDTSYNTAKMENLLKIRPLSPAEGLGRMKLYR